MTIDISFVGRGRDKLGEGALWDPLEQAFYWVDINAPSVQRYDPATHRFRRFPMPDLVGSVGLAAPGTLLVALRHGFHIFDIATGAVRPLALPEDGNLGVRFNDGKMDRQGRYLCGTMDFAPEEKPGLGKLYRLDANLSCHVLETGLGVSNGLCFSPSGTTMYFADSPRGVLWAYDYDIATGTPSNRRVLADTRAIAGSAPDGATVDAQGHIWVALIHAGALGRFTPSGELVQRIDVPIPYPTCPAFGGPGLDTLYCTAISDSGGRLRADHRDAGRLMRIIGTGARGLPETRFRLGVPA